MATQEIKVPDLQGLHDVAVVEVYVSPGDTIEVESPLISLESDKAVMDVPSPLSGVITEVKVNEGDTVNTGDLIVLAEVEKEDQEVHGSSGNPNSLTEVEGTEKNEASSAWEEEDRAEEVRPADTSERPSPSEAPANAQPFGSQYHATPSVRTFARELGVDLSGVTGSGPKGRITREDVAARIKNVMSIAGKSGFGAVSDLFAENPARSIIPGSGTSGFALPPIPTADYASFGDIETEELSRIKKISGPHLHRNWLGIPHVTQFEDADITDLEEFRGTINEENAATGNRKISPLIFVVKAVVAALKRFGDFNGSLSADGSSIIKKKYYNIGIAVDTSDGLVVPVLKNADQKGIALLAEELSDLSSRAREGKLKIDEMKGGTFSISSLGGIGGTYFTPIVNAPEVAILGLSRSTMKPVWNGSEFVPRLILPLSLSYDHRVIDGAQGARFTAYLAMILADIRRTLL